MSKRMNGDEAKRILSDCRPDQCFWVHNGPAIKNLNELSTVMKSLNDEQFTHHVNKEKNDFSNWISDVIGDSLLAAELSKAKNKSAAIKKVNSRIGRLKKSAS